MNNYYKILEVDEKATKADIKKSFKRLAKKYHPDVNKGNSKAEEKFKEISEAYEVLSNDEERRKYDAARSGRGSFNFHGFSQNGPLNDFFNSSGFGGSSFFDEILRSFGGGSSKSQFSGFDSLFGGARQQRASTANLKIPLTTAMMGGKINVSGLPGGAQNVNIPPDTANGSLISVKSSNGKFNLKISVEDEFPFTVKGNNISTTITINFAQAVLGSKIKLRDPKGSSFIVSVPAGSQSGDTLRMRKLGLAGGDMMVKLEIDIPKNLTEKQKNDLVEFAEKMDWKH